MNERLDHLVDDIDRLSHAEANIEDTFAVHLYRFSDGADPISRRDQSPQSLHIASQEMIANTVAGKKVTVFFAVADRTRSHENGAWIFRDGNVEQII